MAVQPTQDSPRRRKDITTKLAARIIDHIRSEGLAQGTHLPAQELADLFNVSRSPVAQALMLLSTKSVVQRIPNRGYYVSGTVPPQAERLGLTKDSDLTKIYFKFAEDRLNGVLGDQASERYLRKTYGLTQGQLSELLNRMSHEGWAERRPGYGWKFSPVLTTPQALAQSYRLRIAIEPAALLEPTFRLPRETIERCRAIEQRLLDGEIETASPDVLYERGVNFHETLAAASQNPFFLDTLRRVNRMRRLFTYRAMFDRQRYYGQVGYHIRILDLLSRGRNEEAADLMRKHLLAVVENLQKIPALRGTGEKRRPKRTMPVAGWESL